MGLLRRLPELTYGICTVSDIEAQRFRNFSGNRLKQRGLVFTLFYRFHKEAELRLKTSSAQIKGGSYLETLKSKYFEIKRAKSLNNMRLWNRRIVFESIPNALLRTQ